MSVATGHLPNGTKRQPRIRCMRLQGSGTFALRVWFPGGAVVEEKPGQACLAGRSLAEGTTRRDWLRLATELEDQGMSLSTFGSLELFGLSLEGMGEDWRTGLEWAAEVIEQPLFDADRVEWLRLQTLAELDSLADQPDVLTGWSFLQQLYGTHPAGRPVQGDRQSLEGLRAEDCRSFYRDASQTEPIVVVVGDIDPDVVGSRVESLFGAASEAPVPRVPAIPASSVSDRQTVVTNATDQAHLYMGHLSVDRDHDDLAALELLAIVLGAGSGLNGRIPQRVREEQGLAYSAQANTVSGASAIEGRLVVYLGTAPENLERAEQSVRTELKDVVANGVSTSELESARSYLLGREPFRRETATQWGDLLAQSSYFGRPWHDPEWRRQRLQDVTMEDVKRAIAAHVRPDELLVTAGIPAESVG